MIEELCEKFMSGGEESEAYTLLKKFRTEKLFNQGCVMGECFSKLFPNSLKILEEFALCCFHSGKMVQTYDLYTKALSMKGLSEKRSKELIDNAKHAAVSVVDRYTNYDGKLVEQICARKPSKFPQITLTITSCKRFDLFSQTVNSFINCCEDIDKIDRWLCIDDNSSEKDRASMKKLYPFFEFYWKSPEEKGHPKSMNIIRESVKTPYIFHMEDDWKFFVRRPYMSECLDVLGEDDRIGQCLINKNYAELTSHVVILGGEFHQTCSGLRYYIQEHVTDEESRKLWTLKHGSNGIHSNYWPHFSFRPSLLRLSILKELGEFKSGIAHFEMEYAGRYVRAGYVSAFLENVYSMHIGRLTSERNDSTKPNAYELNGENQFTQSNTNEKTMVEFKTLVVNLDKRTDRMEKFRENAREIGLSYDRFSAIDGKKLVPNLQLSRIFDNNDYNMRCGMVGCAMSHIQICINLLNSEKTDFYMVFEDDVEFVPDFSKKLVHIYKQLHPFQWDILYLGHHYRKNQAPADAYDKNKLPVLEKWNARVSLTRSLGGTGGYLISKRGAKNFLDFIASTGMTNGIDTVQQKSADKLNVFYCTPHLFYSECYRGDNDPDTDIQHDFSSLTMDIDRRIAAEAEYHSAQRIADAEKFSGILSGTGCEENVYYVGSPREVSDFWRKNCQKNSYLVGNKAIFITKEPDRYTDRVKKDGIYDVSDALTYKE